MRLQREIEKMLAECAGRYIVIHTEIIFESFASPFYPPSRREGKRRGGKNMRKCLNLNLFLVFVPVLVFSFWGCGGFHGGYGAISPDRSVTRSFETFQINPDYHYYYSGSDVYPNALIGLDKQYALEPDLWKKIEPAQKDFRDLISQMQTKALGIGQSQFGFAILDDKGRRIGVWYSLLRASTSVKMLDDRTVLVYQPALNTYDRYEEERASPGSR